MLMGNIHRISNMHMFNYMHEESIVMKIYKMNIEC